LRHCWKVLLHPSCTRIRYVERAPVLKITQSVLMRLENFLFYLIRQTLPRFVF
jgi:hypothetical protein